MRPPAPHHVSSAQPRMGLPAKHVSVGVGDVLLLVKHKTQEALHTPVPKGREIVRKCPVKLWGALIGRCLSVISKWACKPEPT